MRNANPTIGRAVRRLGATGALGAVLIGACAPAATQCSPPPPPAPTPTTVAAPVDLVLAARPVQPPCTYTDTFGAPRDGGRVHLGIDILAAEGNQVYAAVAGVVTKTYSADTAPLTGNGLRFTEPDGTYFFYGHLSALAPGIAVGVTVAAGQLVGFVGHTGNATVPHLHFEVHPGGGDAIDAYPILVRDGAC
jgi:murein DD-endopeptidase MepM/ murein hydrolase activator NlpD